MSAECVWNPSEPACAHQEEIFKGNLNIKKESGRLSGNVSLREGGRNL